MSKPTRDKNLRLVGQQSKYLSHLNKQIVKLRDHTGVYGPVRFGLEDRAEQAREIHQKLEAAEEQLITQTTTTTPPTNVDGISSPSSVNVESAADLETMASNLEVLARRISEMEGLADAQGAGLRLDLQRVMEVFEDPAAFLPTPLKKAPEVADVNEIKQQMKQQLQQEAAEQEKPAKGKRARFSPSSSFSGTSPTPLHESTNLYRGGSVDFSPSPTATFVEPTLLPMPTFTTTTTGPPDPLAQYRDEVARSVRNCTHAKAQDLQEEVRKIGREATGIAQIQAKLDALTGKKVEPRRSVTKGGKKAGEPEVAVKAPSKPPKVPKPQSNPEVYPATNQLMEIFKNGASAAPAGQKVPVLTALAQSIPAYLEYEQYLQEQILLREKEKQRKEEQRLLQEKQEREEAERLAEENARRARALANQPPPLTIAPIIKQPHPTPFLQQPAQPIIPPLVVPPVEYASAGIQTSARAPLSYRQPSIHEQYPPVQDTVWEELPEDRDNSVQWTGVPPQQQPPMSARGVHFQQPQQTQGTASAGPASPRAQRQGASQPGSPRGPSMSVRGGQAGPMGQAPMSPRGPRDGQHAPSIERMGSGRPGTAQGSRKNPLSVIEQAALELQLNAQVRGEGPSSSKALEDLLITAGKPRPGVEGHDSESLENVPTHPLFGGTPAQQLASYPNSGLLALVLQMYDMPSEQQVEKEWQRVLSKEEEEAARLAAEQSGQQEELKQPEPEYKEDFTPQPNQPTVQSPTPATPQPVPPVPADLVDQSRLAELSAIAKAKEEAERARIEAETNAHRLVEELKRVKEEAAQAIQAAKEAAAKEAAAAAAVNAAPVAVPATEVAAPTPAFLLEQARQAGEVEALRKWQAEQAMAAAAWQAQERARAEAASQPVVQATVAVPVAAAPTVPTPSEQELLQSVASEVERIRALQAAEREVLAKARQDESARFAAELARREEERLRVQKEHEQEEARFLARRQEREAEDARRRELEKRRDELMQKKLELEAERTAKEMAALRADVEALRRKQEAPQVHAAFLDRTPLNQYRPGSRRPTTQDTDDTEDSWTSSSELGTLTGPHSLGGTGKHDLSEGEIDMGGRNAAYSPGLLVPPMKKQSKGTRVKTVRHSAVAVHASAESHSSIRTRPQEEKYPTTQEVRDPYDRLNVSSTKDEIADLLRQSQTLRDSIDTEMSLDGSRVGSLPLRMEYNIPYSSSINQVKQALAAPSRQVIVGSASPPLVDDLSRLVRDSIDAIDLGTSTDNIGGLFGMERPGTTGSTLSEPREIELDESALDHSFGGLSPSKPTATEQWLKSLKDEP